MPIRVVAAAALLVCSSLAFAQAPAADAPVAVVAPGLMEIPAFRAFTEHAFAAAIAPRTAALGSVARDLAATMVRFCDAPADDRFAAVGAAFAATTVAWAQLIALPIDPLNVDARRERFFFWPDPRGLTLRQIQPALAELDPTVTDPATLRDKSVALQGLGAIEYLLYGTGAETLLQPGPAGAFRCRYAVAASALLVEIADDIARDTLPDSSFAAFLRAPGPQNPLFATDDAPVTQLLIGVGNAIELARDSLLLPTLGLSVDLARPRAAPLWRSGLALTFLDALVEASRTFFEDARFAELLPPASRWVADSIRWEYASIAAMMPALNAPLDRVAAEGEFRNALALIVRYADNLKALLRLSFPRAVGLSGFNFADGDG